MKRKAKKRWCVWDFLDAKPYLVATFEPGMTISGARYSARDVAVAWARAWNRQSEQGREFAVRPQGQSKPAKKGKRLRGEK